MNNYRITFLIIVLSLCTSLYASEMGELYKEFLRRDALVFTKEQGQIFAFLRNLKYDVKTIKKLELVDINDPNRFIIETTNGDVCFGEINVDILRCKNVMGITTIEFNGDAD